MIGIRLGTIAHARSGDKGSSANIGVIAYTARGYAYLNAHLTAQAVQDFLAPLGVHHVVRYELDNLLALNFLVAGVLAGGGSRSLRIDAQGKALGQVLLEMPLSVAEDELAHMRRVKS